MEFVDGATLSSDGEVTERSSRGISRRSVMKAGAAAAWSVPLVQVVAAAPAVAVSGPTSLSATGGTGGWNGNSANMATRITITNTGANDTSSLQVTFTFTSGWVSGTASAPTGWAPGASSATSFTFVAGTQLAAGQSVEVAPTFTSTNGKGFAAQIAVSPTATGSTSVAGAIQVDARK